MPVTPKICTCTGTGYQQLKSKKPFDCSSVFAMHLVVQEYPIFQHKDPMSPAFAKIDVLVQHTARDLQSTERCVCLDL